MRVLPADGQRDVLLAGAFEEHVAGIAFESDILAPVEVMVVSCRARAEPQRFRPHEQDGLVARLQPLRIAPAQLAERRFDDGARFRRPWRPCPAKGLFSPTKEATKAVAGCVIDRLAVADLLDDALVHHGDAVRHGQRLALVVGDVDEGDADPLLDGAQLVAHMLAQLEVERRERLVEQQHLGLDRERAGDRDALLLAAGELADQLVALARQGDQLRSSSAASARSALRHAAHPQAVGDVLRHGHQRKQRQVLEDQRGRPLVRADARHVLAADPDRAFGRIEEARNRAQDRGLAAAGRPQEGEELAALDLQRRILDRGEIAKPDGDAIKFDVGAHPLPLLCMLFCSAC